MSVRQLSTSRPKRKLRWTRSSGLSVRAYLSARDPDLCPCVSTRSAELTVVLDGEVAIEVGPARQSVRVREGEAIWVPRGLAHAVIVSRDARAFIVDEPATVGELGLRHVPAEKMPASVLRRFDAAWSRRPDTALARIGAATGELVSRVRARTAIPVESTSSTPKMLAAKRILEERYIHPPTLAELAKTVGTSEFYLLRNFKRHFTFTPYAYAQFLRTEHFFWQLLEAEDRRIADIASDSGFGDYSTFHRRMRAMTGVAPSHLVDERAGDVLGPG
jgi:AraC-like DNA-binding protein/mannose-6-phosphate isomerase-like protein (cupin superfamily)